MPKSVPELNRTAKTRTASGDETVAVVSGRCSFPPRYDMERFVASGGMGDIWLYHDRTLGRDIAVKELKSGHALVDHRKQRFIREAKVQAALQHPGIVPIYDFVACNSGGAYFTMRHVEGHTLAEVYAASTRGEPSHSLRQLLTALGSVSLTLQYAHERGVVHRDLKPENIILGDYGEVYVLDWGVAKVFDPDHERPSAVRVIPTSESANDKLIGTLEYMAPEQLAGGADVGPAADVFAMGVVLFEILTGELLREGDEDALVQQVAQGDAIEERLGASGDLPTVLTSLCIDATKRFFRDRPSAREFQQRLQAYLDGVENEERFHSAATVHVQSAQARLSTVPHGPLDTEHRAAAVADLGRALALDPTREDALATLRELLRGDEKELPPGAVAELVQQRNDAARESARASIFVYAAWLALIPLAGVMGIRSLPALAFLITGPALLVIVNLWVDRRGTFSGPLIWFALLLSFTSVSALSVFAGPYLLVPSLAVATAVTYLIAFRGNTSVQLATQVLAPLAVAVPVALQTFGVLPRSYLFREGRVSIEPFAVGLPAGLTEVLFFVGGTLLVVLANYIVTRVVANLDRAEKRALGQAWWFRQLLPEDVPPAQSPPAGDSSESHCSSARPAPRNQRELAERRSE